MLSEYERQQFAEIESRLAAGRVRGRDGDQRRARERRAAAWLALSGLMLLAAGHALSLTALSLLGALALYLVTPCWYLQDMRESWAPQPPEPR